MHPSLKTTRLAFVASLVLSQGAAAFDASALDAGGVTRQLESRDRPAHSLPEAKANKPQIKNTTDEDGQTFDVDRFVIDGATMISGDVLSAITESFVGRKLHFTDVTMVARRISEEYRQQGWLAYVYVPPQDVTAGIITLKVVEARFSGANIEKGSSNPTTNGRVLGYFQRHVPENLPVSLAGIDRALLLADDLPDVSVSAALSAGDAEGQTKLAINVEDQDKWNMGAMLDNHGNQATGRSRSTAYAFANGAFGLSERVFLQARQSKGSKQISAGFSLPIGSRGWQTDLKTTHLQYHLIEPQFTALDAQGRSSTIEIGARYPLVRSRERNVFFNTNASYRVFFNKANQEVQSSYVTEILSVGLSGNFYDHHGGGANSGGSVSVSDGNVRTRVGMQRPGVRKISYSFYRSQRVLSRGNLEFAYFGQYATGDLDSSERFYIGGIDGVRAFSGEQGGGNRGDVAKLDLSVRMTPGVMASVFQDWGRVRPVGGTGWLHCQGSGVGLEWSSAQNSVKVRISIAKGTSLCGSNTTTIDRGANTPKTQAWVQVGASF